MRFSSSFSLYEGYDVIDTLLGYVVCAQHLKLNVHIFDAGAKYVPYDAVGEIYSERVEARCGIRARFFFSTDPSGKCAERLVAGLSYLHDFGMRYTSSHGYDSEGSSRVPAMTVWIQGKLGANAMKRVAAGAHLPTPWLFEPAKRPDVRGLLRIRA